MADLTNANTVDIVGQDAAGRVVLIMVETRQWGEDPIQEAQLKQKINAYTGYILDGDLVRLYPETSGRPVIIQLNCVSAPTVEVEAITHHAALQLKKLGIDFQINVQP